MNKLWYLYVITNLVNGKRYVGITTNPKQRWCHHGSGIQVIARAIKKYGKTNFEFDIWYGGLEYQIKMMEYKFIALLKTKVPNGYNVTDGKEGALGHKHTLETLKKMSLSHVGKKNCLGHVLSVETRRKMSVSRKGQQHLLGYIHSDETRKKMKEAQRGNKNHCAKAIMIDFVEYSCIKDAAQARGINYGTLRDRIRRYNRNDTWPSGCGYVMKQIT